MEQWQIDLIKDAFKRCWGLQNSLSSMPQQAIFELANQTGLQIGFLFEHRNEIYSIENQ